MPHTDYYPFGRENRWVNTITPNYQFEGKIRDYESGLDDFGARFYSSTIGRFMNADWSAVPAPVPYANFTNPQTLNLYAIVHDNPETFADLDGHCGPGGPVGSAGGTGPVTSTTCGPTARGTDAEGELGNSGIANASCSVYSCDNASDVASQGSQVAAQNAAQQQTNVSTVTYAATDSGVHIVLLATVTGSKYKDFNWVQTVTTNDPLPGKPANKPYADTDPGQKSPYYLNPTEQKQAEALAKAHGASTVFSDQPARQFSGKSISWHANLSLVGINKNGSFDRLKNFSYGFTLDAKGVHVQPLRETQ